MQGYWENSVKYHLEKEKRKYQKRMEVKEMESRNKYKVGDTVYVKGNEGEYIITSWVCESSEDEEGNYEFSYYDLKEKNTKRYLECIEEEDIIPITKKKDKVVITEKSRLQLTKTDIDNLLDQYIEFTELHNFLNSNGVVDDQYREKAEGILEFLRK